MVFHRLSPAASAALGTADFDPGMDVRPLAGNGDWDTSYDLCVEGSDVYVVGKFRGAVDFDPGPGTKILESVPGASFVSKFDTEGCDKDCGNH